MSCIKGVYTSYIRDSFAQKKIMSSNCVCLHIELAVTVAPEFKET